MDSLITAAARALAAGDPLGALNRVALRDDAPALALRGIAMAQLGELVRAKLLLRRAARAFGPKEAVARARCVVAEAEIALVSRDLTWPAKALDAARATLEEHGDRVNAAHARYLEVRRLVLIGRLDEAESRLAELDPAPFPPASRAAHELVVAGVAMRRLRTKAARAARARAERAARHAGIPALTAEVESASLVLSTPAARLIARGEERLVLLEVEALLASKAFVVDACRHVVRDAHTVVSLARRPVLFALARALGEAWPGDVARDTLVARAFGAKRADESAAEIVREYGPFPGVDRVHGVTYDDQHVWFAAGDKLNAFDPASGKMLRSMDVAAHAGTAFDGQHLFQIAEDRIQKIDPTTGRVLATIPAPGGGGDSGLAWAEGTLWVGQYRDRKIHQVDPQTGTILRTIESNRFVTGVTWIDGELWHGTWEGDDSYLRRIDPRTGEALERLEMPPGTGVSGLESDGGDRFFCGGGSSGKVRTVRRPKRGSNRAG